MGRFTRGTVAIAAAVTVAGCTGADPAEGPVALPAPAEVEQAEGDAPPIAGHFQSLEDAARACIAVEDGVARAGSADHRYGVEGCERAQDEHGERLEEVIASERDRLREHEPETNLYRADHAELRATWIGDVCTPATGDEDTCRTHAFSEAWPWGADDPLGDLEATYSEPGYCGQWTLSGDGAAFCAATVDHSTS